MFWCASPFSFGRSWCALCLLGFLRAWAALFAVVVGCFLLAFLFPRCLRRSVFSGPGCLRPGRLVVLRPLPPLFFLFFFLRPLVSCVRWFLARAAVGLGALWPPAWPSSLLVFFFFSSSPPPSLFSCFFCFPFFSPLLPFCGFFHFFPALAYRLCGFRAGMCVLGCRVCWCVLLCRWVLLGGVRSLCVVACRVWWRVLCCAWCCVGCLCPAWFLLSAAAPCCHLLVFCRGPWLCSVLGCGDVLLWCAASRSVCCCGAVLFGSRWLVLCGVLPVVTCCCFTLACVVTGAPAWPRGLLPCCVLWFVVVPRPPVLCPVFFRALLPCGAVLWRPAVRFPLLVVLVCVFSLCVPCCVALRVLLFGAGLVCAVVGVSRCGVSLCVVVSHWAFCGAVVLLRCVVVSCCAVCCPVVSCALCCVLRCCAALRCCAGGPCCAVVCAAGVCFSLCTLVRC